MLSSETLCSSVFLFDLLSKSANFWEKFWLPGTRNEMLTLREIHAEVVYCSHSFGFVASCSLSGAAGSERLAVCGDGGNGLISLMARGIGPPHHTLTPSLNRTCKYTLSNLPITQSSICIFNR